MRWLELKIVTGRESGEAVAEKLTDLGAGGVSFEDSQDWETAKKAGLGDIFPEISESDSNQIIMWGFFPLSFSGSAKEQELADFLQRLPEFGLAPAFLFSRELDESAWDQAWKQYWQPTPVGEKFVIVPAWLNADGWPDRLALRLDPGAAFGTGTHETTQLCLEFLEENIDGCQRVLDLGCGSGILALGARLLGAGEIQGVDFDEAAIRASKGNATLNGVDDVDFFQSNLLLAETWASLLPADLIIANLTADVLLALKCRIAKTMRQGARLIASGIILERENDVAAAYEQAGYRIVQQKTAGHWVALLLEMVT